VPTVFLQGGLGNQLFQYAAGRAVALKTNSDLFLEPSRVSKRFNSKTPPRNFHLPQFNINASTTHSPISKNSFLTFRLKVFSLLRPFFRKLAGHICRVHKDHHPRRFSPSVLTLPCEAFLFGYYQSEKYFRNISDILREEITLSEKPSGQNEQLKSQIERQNAVSVHVRRGDYTSHGWVLPSDYYRTAIERICASTEDVTLFFFSDDLEWVRSHIRAFLPFHFPSKRVRYVDCNGEKDAPEDLRLMRSCRHNIIANSTFSWWGAWLNQHSKKVVLAPKHWIHDHVQNLDILPNRWSVVDWQSS